jgi:hypothetical protein
MVYTPIAKSKHANNLEILQKSIYKVYYWLYLYLNTLLYPEGTAQCLNTIGPNKSK